MMAYIYVIGEQCPPYKIGITNNPDRRLKNLQTGHPKKLTIHYTESIPENKVKELEQIIHKTIGHKRLVGEWFDIQLSEAIAEVKYARIRYLTDEIA